MPTDILPRGNDVNVKISCAATALVTLLGCSLDLSNKVACNTDDDCLGNHSCITGVCRAPGALAAGGVSAIVGSGGTPDETPSAGASSSGGSVGGSGAGGAPAGVAGGEAGAASVSDGLLALTPSYGVLVPSFQPAITDYTIELSELVSELSFTPVISADFQVTLQNQELVSGVASAVVALSADGDRLELDVRMGQAEAKKYTVSVSRNQAMSGLVLKPVEQPGGTVFGVQVAADGDVLAVANMVSVDVYRDRGDGYRLEARLTPELGGDDDSYGVALAVSGDRLVVGAPREDSSARGVDGDRENDDEPESGAVYVYVHVDGSWREEAYLKASNTQLGDAFGSSVALRGDLLAVGAPMESSDASGVDGAQDNDARGNSGAVYLFERGAAGWQQTAYVKAAQDVPGNAHAFFGQQLALGDGTLIVSAPNEDSAWLNAPVPSTPDGMPGAGAVYVLGKAGGEWQHQQRLQASNPELNDSFGLGLSLAGELLAVGAPYEDSAAVGVDGAQADNGSQDSGAVYLFAKTAQGFEQRAYLKAQEPRAGSAFGWSVALRGATLVVGAWAESRRDGGAHLFALADGHWSERRRVDAETARGNVADDAMPDTFGYSLALSERALFIGAPFERPFGSEAGIGTAYCFK